MTRMLNALKKRLARCCAPLQGTRVSEKDALRYARLFKALGDETRIEIVSLLANAGKELCACEIEAHFDLSQPTISHHLKILREAGVITAERQGLWIYFKLNRPCSGDMADFMRLLK
ncbi:MAG: winged helix-turn-helix transcriptional regulator [Armatimonadetes bacterium]|nr:winged helix-turn-helix transcriptional regulator [Armatimonadota bacterium]